MCCYRIHPVFGNYGVIIRLIPTCHCAVGSSSGRFHIIDPWKQYAAINSWYKCCWSPKGTKTPPIKKQSKSSSCNMNLINLIKEKQHKHKRICFSLKLWLWIWRCDPAGVPSSEASLSKYDDPIPVGSFCPAMGAVLIHCWSTLRSSCSKINRAMKSQFFHLSHYYIFHVRCWSLAVMSNAWKHFNESEYFMDGKEMRNE